MDKDEDAEHTEKSVNESVNVLNCVCDLVQPPVSCVFLPGPRGFHGDVWLFVLRFADSYQTINISSVYLPGVAVLYTHTPRSRRLFWLLSQKLLPVLFVVYVGSRAELRDAELQLQH